MNSENLSLFRQPKESYGSEYEKHLFEQYKLYVEMADRISQRRHSANIYFLSINTALVSVSGLLYAAESSSGYFSVAWRAIVPIAGIVLCVTWYFIINSYRQLNSVKFEVVHALEQLLPAAPYDTEWKVLGEGRDHKLYWPFTHIEQAVPWVFGLLYLALLGLVVPWQAVIHLIKTLL